MGNLLIKEFCLSLHLETAGEDAFRLQTFSNSIFHRVPDILQKRPDVFALIQLDIVTELFNVAPFAEIRYLSEGILGINLGRIQMRMTGDPDITATDRLHPQRTQLGTIPRRVKVQCVGMGIGKLLVGEYDLGRNGGQNLAHNTVGAVAYTGLA